MTTELQLLEQDEVRQLRQHVQTRPGFQSANIWVGSQKRSFMGALIEPHGTPLPSQA